jgi:hypothetical protein
MGEFLCKNQSVRSNLGLSRFVRICVVHEVSCSLRFRDIMDDRPTPPPGPRTEHLKREAAERTKRLKRRRIQHRAPFHIPPFDEDARGTPWDWNKALKPIFWGQVTARRFPPVPGSVVDPKRIVMFLDMRPGPDGLSVSARIGKPISCPEGWFCCPWLSFREGELATQTAAGKTQWETAWHGCKFEALFSIMYNGFLATSNSVGQGHRYFDNTPGIYVFKDSLKHKAEHYARFTPLCQDGVFWAAVWEVRVNRTERVAKKKTDQWVQRGGSVELVSLWLRGLRHEEMEPNCELSEAWTPRLEANPCIDVMVP